MRDTGVGMRVARYELRDTGCESATKLASLHFLSPSAEDRSLATAARFADDNAPLGRCKQHGEATASIFCFAESVDNLGCSRGRQSSYNRRTHVSACSRWAAASMPKDLQRKVDAMSGEQPKWIRISLLVVSGLLAFVFVGAGFVKLVGFEFAREDFVHWQYPAWFRILTGLIEVGAAALIAIPRTRYFGAVILMWVMVGAIITHLKANEANEAIVPLALFFLAGFVWWNILPRIPAIEKTQAAEQSKGEAKSA